MQPNTSSPPVDRRAVVAEIRRLARSIGQAVVLRDVPAPGRRRRRGEGTVYRREDGLWVARVQRNGARHQVSAVERDECLRRLRELLAALDAADRPIVPAAEFGPNGREFVRLNDPAFRRWIYARDGGRCALCGQPVAFEAMHVDHVRPRLEGGTDDVDNLRVTHPRCNLVRGVRRQEPIALRR